MYYHRLYISIVVEEVHDHIKIDIGQLLDMITEADVIEGLTDVGQLAFAGAISTERFCASVGIGVILQTGQNAGKYTIEVFECNHPLVDKFAVDLLLVLIDGVAVLGGEINCGLHSDCAPFFVGCGVVFRTITLRYITVVPREKAFVNLYFDSFNHIKDSYRRFLSEVVDKLKHY